MNSFEIESFPASQWCEKKWWIDLCYQRFSAEDFPPTAWVEEMGSTVESLWNILEWVSRGKSVICDDWQATFHMSETSWMPQGEIPPKISDPTSLFCCLVFWPSKNGGKRFYQKVHFWFRLPKIGPVKVCFQSSWGQSFLKLNFFTEVPAN